MSTNLKAKVLYVLSIFIFLGLVGWGPISFFYEPLFTYDQVPGSEKWINEEIKAIGSQAPTMNPTVLKLSLSAFKKAKKKHLVGKDIITIIDYSMPSAKCRLWVVDLKQNKVIMNTYVAHGKNSGEERTTSFSNKPHSLKSSFGVFLTDEVYEGHNGTSLRIQGLEPGINDNVYSRNVVFHGASYVSKHIAKENGKVGKSHGCMAVSRDIIEPLIKKIKGKTLVFAYYPDHHWLKHSAFLHS